MMIYRRLGKTGLKVSALGFGNWVTGGKVDEEEMYKILVAAYKAGINLIDTAEVYGMGAAELQLGRLLKRGIEENVWKRSDLVVSTKLYKGGNGPNDVGLSRKRIVDGLEASLERLQLKRVDLLFAHRPDRDTPMEEIVRAFSHVVDRGLALYWGTSEWDACLIAEALQVARQYNLNPPFMEQPQYNMFFRDKVEREYYDLYRRETGLGLTIWSPLRYGILTGKYNDGIPEGSRLTGDFFKSTREKLEADEGKLQIEKVKKLTVIANELGCKMSQLALAWTILNPNVSSCLLGASKLEQIEENLGSLAVLPKLTPEVVERIEAILQNKPPSPIVGYG
eukprot:TRINITY_DN11559_c0_g1_i1.p1 TRINITY_DN11559_c0_g1~~TRINITY_DN11559_c0_g1_i1.p1  ORF type:complete len:337 (+),score=77.61 TRINITY_DN11559_c0_g1_i1:205-1215(+)